MANEKQENQDRLAQLRADHDRLVARAAEIREGVGSLAELSEDQIKEVEEMEGQLHYVRNQIAARERLESVTSTEAQAAQPQRRTEPVGDTPQRPVAFRDPRCGFNDLGDFARAVAAACAPRAQLDERLARMAPTTYSNEGAGPDGGYMIPPEFSAQVMEYISDANSLYSMCRKTPVNNHLAWPVDEESPWSTSGPQAYWEAEAEQYTQSKVKLRSASMALDKLVALCPVTDELLADSAQLGAYLSSVISKKLRWKVDDAIINGTGAGMPLGILNAPCVKSVAKESGQTAATVNSTNILKMFNAMFGDYRGNAVWISNQDVEVQLLTMVVAGSSSDVPVWLPSGSGYSSFSGSPHTSIVGRPHVPHQACQTLGTVGDILFCDLQQYIIGEKTGGPQFASSVDLYFDYGMTAVRATWRLCGMPLWSTTISANNGSATYSPFVSLATRA